MTSQPPADLPAEMGAFLREIGITDPPARAEPIAGGVSSDIWMVELGSRRICIKRALPALKVAADWRAPIERSRYEFAWFACVARLLPHNVPQLVGRSGDGRMFAMEFLSPRDHRLWKTSLLEGVVDADFAGAVGAALVAIHAGTAGDPQVAANFASDSIFHALRLEPYLVATAAKHPDLGDRLTAIVSVTAATRLALVHGDVSPKNILAGPDGPVFLDAECAWYGDPAFDLGFCLNHLMLKCLPLPQRIDALEASFATLVARYLAGVSWEPAEALERRAAALLPALFLARIDGKSPVEYVVDDADRTLVRTVARRLIAEPIPELREIMRRWTHAVRRR
jgi:aminoglycoside phosphotransferase (APT) family kinase protein